VKVLSEERSEKEISKEVFPIPEKLIEFLEQNIFSHQWLKISEKDLRVGIDYPKGERIIYSKMFKIIHEPDIMIIKEEKNPDPILYKEAYRVILEYPSYTAYLHIGEKWDHMFELIDIDVKNRINCECKCD
jgi:hypothetical protein